MARPATGVYKLISALNSQFVIDVRNGSTEVNAQLNIYGDNGTAAQKFITIDGYESDQFRRFVNQNSGMAAYVPMGESPSAGSLVRQYPTDWGTIDLDWLCVEDSTKKITINGVSYNTYKLAYRPNGTLVMDCKNGATTAYNDIIVYTSNDTLAQRWVLMKDSCIDTSLPVPNAQILRSGNKLYEVARNASESRTMSISDYSAYQMRMRYRVLEHNTNAWTEWTDWLSPTNSKNDEGWGNAWASNASSTNTIKIEGANDLTGSTTLDVDKPFDSVNYQYEIRAFKPHSSGKNWQTHGNPRTLDIKTKQLLTASVDSAVRTAYGLVIDYSTNSFRTLDKCNIVITLKQDSKVIAEKVTLNDKQINNGSILIEYGDMRSMPDIEKKLNVTLTVEPISNYLTGSTKSASIDISESGGTLKPAITFTKKNEYDIEVGITEATGKSYTVSTLSLIYEHGGRYIVRDIEKTNGKFIAPVPINTSSLFIATLIKMSGSTISEWGSKQIVYSFPQRYATSCVLNSKELEYEFKYSQEKWPVGNISGEMSSKDMELGGVIYESVFYDDRVRSNFNIDEVRFPASDRQKVEQIIQDKYVLVRDSRGQFINAAIKNFNFGVIDIETEKVTLQLSQISRDVDVTLES